MKLRSCPKWELDVRGDLCVKRRVWEEEEEEDRGIGGGRRREGLRTPIFWFQLLTRLTGVGRVR